MNEIFGINRPNYIMQLPPQPPSKLDETNQFLHDQNEYLQDIQIQLQKANEEIKQLNNKTVNQTYQIKELRFDLDKEIKERKVLEDKLSKKDWKIILASLISGIASGIIVGLII